jgi:hypothetical protein
LALAIFHKPYDHDFRPAKGVCIHIKALPEAQSHPEAIIAAAEAAGFCSRVDDPRVSDAPVTASRKAK